MFMGPSSQHTRVRWGCFLALRRCLPLGIVFVLAIAASSQQSPSNRSRAQTSPSAQSPFFEAQTLLSQGRIAEAKKTTQDQLKLHPSSVEGYNLLGIICANEKYAAGALEAFQHALKLEPNSTKTHNNLANLYVADGKIDLAEREFQKVLALAP